MNRQLFNTKQALFLSLLWATVQSYTFLKFGILTELEAGKYIREAGYLIDQGRLSDGGYVFYILEILVIAGFKAVNANIEYAVIVPLAINALAMRYLWRIISNLTDPITSSFTTALFIVFLPIQQFNFQLQTESLFISLIIFHTYYAMESSKGNKPAVRGMLIAQTLLIFSRPTGILWILPTTLALYHLTRRSVNKKTALSLSAVLLLLSLLSIDFVVSKIGQFDLITPWKNGNIICEVPSDQVQALVITEQDPRSLTTPLTLVRDNFTFFLKLAYLKTISFFGFYRPYYSWAHNLLLMLFVLPVYLFSIIGLMTSPKEDRRALSIPISGILITYIMVLLTCDDWHNRFSLSIISLFLMLAAIGIFRIKEKFHPTLPQHTSDKPNG